MTSRDPMYERVRAVMTPPDLLNERAIAEIKKTAEFGAPVSANDVLYLIECIEALKRRTAV
jgi:hypothetical protein